jgi:vacuolar-type H+-ATPase subunit C/Vma6
MTIYLGDLNARARGLQTRLLSPSDRRRLAHAKSLFGLRRELGSLGLVRAEGPLTPGGLERELRQRAATSMTILGRWCTDERRSVVAVVLEDEDRRSLLSLIRGAERGVSSDARMSGLVPTPQLSERALRLLAAQPTMADVVRVLALWDHPYAPALIPAVTKPKPSLFEVEVSLLRAFAARALSDAARGGAHLLEYARQTIDVANAWSVLLHFSERDAELVDLVFVPGGRFIDRDAFSALLALDEVEEVRKALGKTFRASALGAAFTDTETDLSMLESEVLRAQIAEQRRAARVAPESAAPLIRFALELRAELLDLQRIIWGVSLEAPAALLEARMLGA